MPFHVVIWPKSPSQQLLRELYAFNLNEDLLRSRFIDPYDLDIPITWSGRSLPAGDISYLKVFESDSELDEKGIRDSYVEHDAINAQREVTNTWITHAPGSKRLAQATTKPASVNALDDIDRVCRKFGRAARQLTRRHGGRPTLVISDEYDVQDLLHALLVTAFEDVRDETWNPHYLGGSTRVDFRIPDHKVVIEVKHARTGHTDKQIGVELAEDITRYGSPEAAGAASVLVCFVYDPEHKLSNPRGLERDLAAASTDRLKVVGIVDPL